MRIKEQFNRHANSYNNYSHIQKIGAKILTNEIKEPIKNIADLGCGDGRIYNELINKNMDFKNFYAIDFASDMLTKHPKNKNIQEIYGDFNSKELFLKLQKYHIDVVVSSSALQWAKNLNFTFNESSKIAPKGYFFIFTSNTFKTMHNTIDIKSPIYSKKEIIKFFSNNYKINKIKTYNFELEFKSTIDMLYYIKKSGVSGGMNIGYKAMKKLINTYPKKYLEFETILLIGDSKCLN